jgi:hypothetical protein
VGLVDCGMSLPEAELMKGNETLFVATSVRIRCKSSFSKTLETTGRRLIGRY